MDHSTSRSLLAYHADPALRARVLAATAEHVRMDEVAQGTCDDENGRGRQVGCLCRDFGLRSDDGAGLGAALGWPEALLLLTDRIHEGLPPAEARLWPGRMVEAVPLGADLTMVVPRFMLALLTDPKHGAIVHVQGAAHAQQRAAVEDVAALLCRRVAGEVVADNEWAAAKAKAGAARWAAAAGWAAEWAAEAGWAAAAGWATAVATAVAAGWATAAGWAAAWTWQAKTLIEILVGSAPVPEKNNVVALDPTTTELA